MNEDSSKPRIFVPKRHVHTNHTAVFQWGPYKCGWIVDMCVREYIDDDGTRSLALCITVTLRSPKPERRGLTTKIARCKIQSLVTQLSFRWSPYSHEWIKKQSSFSLFFIPVILITIAIRLHPTKRNLRQTIIIIITLSVASALFPFEWHHHFLPPTYGWMGVPIPPRPPSFRRMSSPIIVVLIVPITEVVGVIWIRVLLVLVVDMRLVQPPPPLRNIDLPYWPLDRAMIPITPTPCGQLYRPRHRRPLYGVAMPSTPINNHRRHR